MFTVGRRGSARLAAAMLASGLFAAGAIVGAGQAAADPIPTTGGATATLGSLVTADAATIHDPGDTFTVEAGLFQMNVAGGGTIETYCIDLRHPTARGARYQEVPWSSSSLGNNPNAGKIEWILQHSYPQQNDLQQLAQEAHVSSLTPGQAAAGTQVAIWRYSDHADAIANNPNAEKLSEYLYNAAKNDTEPGASLSLTPPAVSGKSGTRIGPVTVHTNAGSAQASLSPQPTAPGVTVVDASGHKVTSASDGSQLYFNVPAGTAPGNATLDVAATTTVPVGRVFQGVDQNGAKTASQLQILAGSSASTVTAHATATWAKQGAIPAVSAMVNCARSGVDVTVSDHGDEAFAFQIAGKEYTVAAGKSQTITVPVKEGQNYSITITGSNHFKKTFSGVLNCKLASASGSTPSPTPSALPVGGAATGGKNLAETGASNATPYIAGAAVVLVLIGGGTIFLVRRRKSAPAEK